MSNLKKRGMSQYIPYSIVDFWLSSTLIKCLQEELEIYLMVWINLQRLDLVDQSMCF